VFLNLDLAGHTGLKIHGPNARKQSSLADKKIGEVAEMNTGNSRIMTVRELADYLRVHPITIYRQLKCGQLPAFRVGSDWRFDVEAIDRWCLGQNSSPAQRGLKVHPSK
jgi:excisionase family DNA binding protein